MILFLFFLFQVNFPHIKLINRPNMTVFTNTKTNIIFNRSIGSKGEIKISFIFETNPNHQIFSHNNNFIQIFLIYIISFKTNFLKTKKML